MVRLIEFLENTGLSRTTICRWEQDHLRLGAPGASRGRWVWQTQTGAASNVFPIEAFIASYATWSAARPNMWSGHRTAVTVTSPTPRTKNQAKPRFTWSLAGGVGSVKLVDIASWHGYGARPLAPAGVVLHDLEIEWSPDGGTSRTLYERVIGTGDCSLPPLTAPELSDPHQRGVSSPTPGHRTVVTSSTRHKGR